LYTLETEEDLNALTTTETPTNRNDTNQTTPEADTDIETETNTEPETDTNTEPETETNTEPETETNTEPETGKNTQSLSVHLGPLRFQVCTIFLLEWLTRKSQLSDHYRIMHCMVIDRLFYDTIFFFEIGRILVLLTIGYYCSHESKK
jgi:hypothetical protein